MAISNESTDPTVFENSGENALDGADSTGNSRDREGTDGLNTKRFFVFKELLQTEANYLVVLNTIIDNFKEPLYESRLIPSTKYSKIFGERRFEDLREVHEKILSSLQLLDCDWTEKALIGQVWSTALDDLRRVYVPYCQKYDEITDILKSLVANDPQIRKLIQELEANSDNKKYRLEDLLVRPVQRLASVKLLLERLLKETSEKNPDRPWLEQALIAVGTVLLESNEKRGEMESYAHTLTTINEIDQFPPGLVKSTYLLVASADFRILKGGEMFAQVNKGIELTIFLFKGFLTFAMRRIQRTESTGFNHSASTSFGGTLQRNPSFITFMKPKECVRKPFKHLETICFADVCELAYVRENGIFFLRLGDSTPEEKCTALQIASDTNVGDAVKFFTALCQQVNSTSSRHLELVEVSEQLNQAEPLVAARQKGRPVKDGVVKSATLSRAAKSIARFASARFH